MRFHGIAAAAIAAATGCSGAEEPTFAEPGPESALPGVEMPQNEATPTSLVARAPLTGLGTVFVNGFHYAADDPRHQMEANHYCRNVAEALQECAVFDVYGRLTGTEHIIGREAFDRLPARERKLWHAHTYEVRSGLLVAPDLSAEQEHALMAKLVTTYGKIWDVYPGEAEPVPTGEPRLMKGFTADGQLHPSLLEARDARFGISAAEKRAARADIPDPGFDPIVLEVGPPPPTGNIGILTPIGAQSTSHGP